MSDPTTALMGKTLQIRFDDGWTSLVNSDVEDFAAIEAMKQEEGSVNRKFEFAVQGARNVSNAQLVSVGVNDAPFVEGSGTNISTYNAAAKQIEVVCQFDQPTFERAKRDPDLIYEDPMDAEIYDQQINAKEVILRDWATDGTGALCTSTGAGSIGSGRVTVTVYNNYAFATKPGFIYLMSEGMKLVSGINDGTEQTPTVSSGTFSYWLVESVDYDNNQMVISARDASDSELTVTVTNLTDLSIFYPASDKAQLSGLLARDAVSDYGNLLHMPGRQSLGADDSRVVNEVTLTGSYAGTQKDCSGDDLHYTQFNDLLQRGARRVGRSKYDWKTMQASFKAYNHLINLDEGNKIIKHLENERGGRSYYYVRGRQKVELVEGRFCPDYEIWFEPSLREVKGSSNISRKAPVRFLFSGFDFIKDPDSGAMFRYKIKSGTRRKTIESTLQAWGTFVASQNAAILRMYNFGVNA